MCWYYFFWLPQICGKDPDEWTIIQKSFCIFTSNIRCKWGINFSLMIISKTMFYVQFLVSISTFDRHTMEPILSFFQSTDQQVQGVLNLIDLAGSERLSKSGSTGDRLKETQVCKAIVLSIFSCAYFTSNSLNSLSFVIRQSTKVYHHWVMLYLP